MITIIFQKYLKDTKEYLRQHTEKNIPKIKSKAAYCLRGFAFSLLIIYSFIQIFTAFVKIDRQY